MAEPRLLRRLDLVGNRLRTLRSLWTASLGWAILSIAILILWATNQPSLALSVTLFAVPTVMICAAVAGARRKSDRHQAALLIEKTYPELDSRLITAVEQHPPGGGWNFTYLQSELLTQTFAQLRHQNWHRAVASRRIMVAHIVHGCLLILCVTLIWPMVSALNVTSTRTDQFHADSGPRGTGMKVTVEPGDVELERGSSLLVLARFPEQTPTAVELVAVDEDNKEIRIPLQKSLEDPVFGGRLSSVQKDLKYHVEFDGIQSDTFHVSLFDLPALVKADATVISPEFTGLPPKTIENVRKVTVVEGGTVELVCEFNSTPTTAQLLDEKRGGMPIDLTARPDNERVATARWTFDEPGDHRFKLRLLDQSGRSNRDPVEFRITVAPNREPDLKVTFPSKDLRVSSLQELLLEARASDDFGLTGMGLIYQTPTGEEEVIDFGKAAAPDETARVEHLLAVEKLKAKPDDLISYYFYADDIGPRGETRRSFSDLFFAEVRPFEEIFRQAPESPSASSSASNSAQGQEGSPTSQLLDLQRDIVTASWNVLRKERQDRLSTSFQSNVETLEQSQSEVLELTQTLSGQVSDEMLKRYAQQAARNMAEAAQHFQQGKANQELSEISQGRVSAQRAYQELLKLQAHESMVAQSQSGQSQQGGASRQMNQQLDSLRLKNDRNRYQSERQAQQEQTQADQASLQVLNRLKDLARRQEDLNQRIRELEMAMREATDEEQRNEIQRQLQRLQEEQEELLRDLDDVREKMDQAQNRQQMAEAREKAEETRERLVRASEALKEGQTSRALTEGTRAQREFHELEEDLRKQAAGQFDDRIRQLREDARELTRRQEEIAEKIQESPQSLRRQQRTLGDTPATEDAKDQLTRELQTQKDKLEEIMNRTRSLVEDSETSEPILSKRLYETLRDLRKYQPEEALDAAVQFSQQGIRYQIPELERQAREGIQHLQSGIEQAAESILGDEEAALKLARSELSELTEALRRELAMNDAEFSERQPGERQSDNSPSTSGSNSQSPSDSADQTERSGSRDDQLPGNTTPPGEGSERANRTPAPTDGDRDTRENSEMNSSGQSSRGDAQDQSPQPSPSGERPSPSGEQSGEQQQPGRGQQGQQGQQPNGQQARQQSQQPSGQVQRGSGQQQGQTGEPSSSENRGLSEDLQRLLGLGGASGGGTLPEEGPLTGERFTEWSNRLQDVEDLLPTPELRAQATAIRDRARRERIEIKRHSKAPDWELVRTSIYGPLIELESQVAEELARRNPEKQIVPIDRDPVPERYSEFVRSYYEQLSRQSGSND